jgi:hypothetical protein
MSNRERQEKAKEEEEGDKPNTLGWKMRVLKLTVGHLNG